MGVVGVSVGWCFVLVQFKKKNVFNKIYAYIYIYIIDRIYGLVWFCHNIKIETNDRISPRQ